MTNHDGGTFLYGKSAAAERTHTFTSRMADGASSILVLHRKPCKLQNKPPKLSGY